MKKYQNINEGATMDAAEKSLLENMFNFYLQKYASLSVDQTEQHFLIAVGSLVERGEISEKVVKSFLDENGIEGAIPKKKPEPTHYSRPSSSC